MFLMSKAFKNKVTSWIIKRWKNLTDELIINDLLSHFEITEGLLGKVNHTALAYIITAGKIELIPIKVFKLLPPEVFNEKVIRVRGPNTTDLDILTLREYLTWKRNCPKTYKEIIRCL